MNAGSPPATRHDDTRTRRAESQATGRDSGEAGTRTAIVEVLRASRTPMSAGDLATTLDVHPNTVRFHLEALTADDQVEWRLDARSTVGRPRKLYSPVPGMNRRAAMNYRLLAEIIVDEVSRRPDAVERAVEIGRRWGAGHAAEALGDEGASPATDVESARNRLRSLLSALGFAPTGPGETPPCEIGLTHCPFLDLAADHPNVVCGIHLGLMQGALDAWNAPLEATSLERFRTPELCVAHVRDK